MERKIKDKRGFDCAVMKHIRRGNRATVADSDKWWGVEQNDKTRSVYGGCLGSCEPFPTPRLWARLALCPQPTCTSLPVCCLKWVTPSFSITRASPGCQPHSVPAQAVLQLLSSGANIPFLTQDTVFITTLQTSLRWVQQQHLGGNDELWGSQEDFLEERLQSKDLNNKGECH